MNKVDLKRLAEKYNSKRGINLDLLEKILSYIETYIANSSHVLDLGCGAGRFLVPLAKRHKKARFIGIDKSKEMINKIVKQSQEAKLENVFFLKADFNQKDWAHYFKKEFFDLILATQSIHFSNSLNMFSRNIDRLLKPNSHLIIFSTTHEQFKDLPYCLAFPGALEKEIERTPDKKDIIRLFKNRGIDLVKNKSITVKEHFTSKEHIRDWLESEPFSVFSLLSKKQFKEGVVKFLKRYGGQRYITVDKFEILVFKK